MGIMFAHFHIARMSACATEGLKRDVKYVIARGPRNFRCREVRPSGPKAVEFEDIRIALLVS
jgi:hypothetical protein